MLDEDRRVGVETVQLTEQHAVVERALTRDRLGEVDRELAGERDVLGVAAADVRAQLREALAQQARVVVELRRAVDEVGRVEVDGELRPVDRAEQLEVAVGRVGQAPRHRLERVEGPTRPDRVDDLAHGVDDQRERLAAEVVGMWPVPAVRARAGEVDAAARAHAIGELELPLGALDRGGPGRLVGAERVAPRTDLGDHDVRRGGRVRVGIDGARVGVVVQRPVGGPEAMALHRCDPAGGGVPRRWKGRAEPQIDLEVTP